MYTNQLIGRAAWRSVSALLAIAILCAGARASDVWVDAVHGSNGNGGTGPGDAWQTVTHALSMVAPPSTIHVAPGTYDPALGEVFPLVLTQSIELRGSGPDVTHIDGVGTPESLVRIEGGGSFIQPPALVEGFSFVRSQTNAISIWSEGTTLYVVLRDLDVSLMGAGVAAVPASSDFQVQIERTEITGCGRGIYLAAFNHAGSVALDDCVISDNAGNGLEAFGTSGGFSVGASRCRLERNAGLAIYTGADLFGGHSIGLADTLVAGNGGGIHCAGTAEIVATHVGLSRCTVADNTGAGLSGYMMSYDLAGCLLWGNGDDIEDVSLIGTITYCDVGDGDFAGQNGNFSADPLFRDAGGGDYRLRFGSPCIDTGDPTTSTATGLAGTPRPVDGDLDTAERDDVGAFEFAPLVLVRAPTVGGLLALECWGDAGGNLELFASRFPLEPSPLATIFGEFDLYRGWVYSWAVTPVMPGPPAYFVWNIPDDPSLAGMRISLQGRTDSVRAPSGRAFTNAVTMILDP